MLEELRVRDLGVIDDVTVTFRPGMTALTGETGAGKTLLIEALSLLLGGRADPTLVRAGSADATVEGRFGPEADAAHPPDASLFDEDDPEGGEIILSRTVTAGGRSKAWINGRMAPVTTLTTTGSALVELHGQHQHRSLIHTAAQRAALDEYGRIDLSKLTEARSRMRVLTDESASLGGEVEQRAREMDVLRYQIDEIESARIEDDAEDSRLELEEDRLAEAAAHREAAAAAVEALAEATTGSALDRLAEASGALAGRPPLAALDARGCRGRWPSCRISHPSCGRWSTPGRTIPSGWRRSGAGATNSASCNASTGPASDRWWPSPTMPGSSWRPSRPGRRGPASSTRS